MIKWRKKSPSTTYLDEGLIAWIIKRYIKRYFAYKSQFNHITQYFRFWDMKPSLRYVVEGFCLRHLDEFRALWDRFGAILEKKYVKSRSVGRSSVGRSSVGRSSVGRSFVGRSVGRSVGRLLYYIYSFLDKTRFTFSYNMLFLAIRFYF